MRHESSECDARLCFGRPDLFAAALAERRCGRQTEARKSFRVSYRNRPRARHRAARSLGAGGSGEVMDRWKSDNYETGGERLTSRASLSRRLIGLAGVAALTVGGAGAVLLGAGTAYAITSPTLASNNFTIGTSSVGGVTFAASSSTTLATAVVYTFGFTLPAGVSGAQGVTPGGLPGATTTGANVVLVNNTTGTNYGVATITTATTGAFTIPVGDVVAGDTYTAQVFGFTNSGTAGTYSPTVAVTGYQPRDRFSYRLSRQTFPGIALDNDYVDIHKVTR